MTTWWQKTNENKNLKKFAFFVFTGILDESGGSSFFFSSLDSRDAKIVQLPTATGGGDVPTDIEDDETIKVSAKKNSLTPQTLKNNYLIDLLKVFSSAFLYPVLES